MTKSKKFLLAWALLSILLFAMPMTAFAAMEDLGGTQQNYSSDDQLMGSIGEDDLEIGDVISEYRGMTGGQFKKASQTLSPLTNIFGYITGGILVITFAGVFIITALDLAYIAIPPFRNWLYKGQQTGAVGDGGMPMGGGYGRGGYGMGGMGGMSMNQGMAAENRFTQWISDEAVQCAAMLQSGGAQPQPMGGMMGGMMGQQQPAQNVSMKSVISMYFKKRVWFMIFLAIAAIVLTSSVLLKTGINLGEWVIRMVNMINGNLPT